MRWLPPRCVASAPRPHGSGALRLARLAPTALLVAVTLACTFSACANHDENQVDAPTVVGVASDAAPFYSDGEVTLYQSQRPVPLRVRRPTAEDAKSLGQADPYPHAPFLLASDLRVEIDFVLSNLGAEPVTVELLVDPWNEFVRYQPTVAAVSDDITLPSLAGYDRLFTLPPKSRTSGVITADDTSEMAIDLATVQAIVATPPADDSGVSANALVNHVFNLQNRSNGDDPLVKPYLPQVIAGLAGFDLGLRTFAPADVAVEATVDLTDDRGGMLLAPDDTTAGTLGPPATVLKTP